MPTYTTNFSLVLPIECAEKRARALALYTPAKPEDPEDAEDAGFLLEENESPPGLAIYSDDGNGEPAQVINFILQVAEACDLTGIIGFDWAHTCSRPVSDAFGGGAVILNLTTRQTVTELDTKAWLAAHLPDPVEKSKNDAPAATAAS